MAEKELCNTTKVRFFVYFYGVCTTSDTAIILGLSKGYTMSHINMREQDLGEQ